MQGTALFALGIVAAVLALITFSGWLVGIALALLVPAVLMLRRVGKSLSE
jgi:hypothetical protein